MTVEEAEISVIEWGWSVKWGRFSATVVPAIPPPSTTYFIPLVEGIF